MHRITVSTFTALALVVAGPVAAQERAPERPDRAATAEGMPEGWLMRLDRAAAGPEAVSFRTMEPGWHVATGGAGAGIFWRPEMAVSGTYRAEATLHLMQRAQHPEAFGIFIGGQNLEAADQSYLYFLVRQNGQYLVKRRSGADTEDVVGWTAHDAIPVAGGDGSTRYDLAVDVGAETVDFIVNGVTVHSVPRAGLATDGVVGARINHRLDVHVEKLDVS